MNAREELKDFCERNILTSDDLRELYDILLNTEISTIEDVAHELESEEAKYSTVPIPASIITIFLGAVSTLLVLFVCVATGGSEEDMAIPGVFDYAICVSCRVWL